MSAPEDSVSDCIYSVIHFQEVHFHIAHGQTHWKQLVSIHNALCNRWSLCLSITPTKPEHYCCIFVSSISKSLKLCETCVAGYYDDMFITWNWGYISYPEAWLEDVKQCLRKSFGAVYGRKRQGCLSFAYSVFWEWLLAQTINKTEPVLFWGEQRNQIKQSRSEAINRLGNWDSRTN